MNTSTLIDAVLAYTDNVDQNDADYTLRRARILEYAQQTAEEAWNADDFVFKVTGPSTLTLPAWTLGNPSRYQLPTDFASFGKVGKVFNSNNGVMLEEVSITELMPWLGRVTADTANPGIFAVVGYDGGNIVTATPKNYYIVVPNLTAAVPIRYFYQTVPPTLADSTTDNNNLYKFPVSYHRTVLLPGTISKTEKAKGDARDWKSEYFAGLAKMVANETPRRTSTQRLPKSISGKW